jgi:hypothetical protein
MFLNQKYLDKNAYRVSIYRTFQVSTQGILLISRGIAEANPAGFMILEFKKQVSRFKAGYA